MPVKFEWQFKYRDERFLNADALRALIRRQKLSIHAGFPHFCGFRFTLPVGDRVTIADARLSGGSGEAVIRHPPTHAAWPADHAPLIRPTAQHYRKGGKTSSPGINRTGGKDEGVGNTSGSYLAGIMPAMADQGSAP